MFDLIKRNRKIGQVFLFTWVLIIITVSGLSFLCIQAFNPVAFKTLLMIQSAAVVVAGFLFIPDWTYVTNRWFIMLWSLSLALAFIVVTIIQHANIPLLLYLKVSIAVFVMSFCLFSLSRAVFIQFPNNPTIPWIIFCLLALFTTHPVWLAPWVEVIATTPEKLQLIIWSSPLTFLATVLDYDYLRSQWFYQHTPYGMLRYDYPNPMSSHFALVFVSLLLLAIKSKQ